MEIAVLDCTPYRMLGLGTYLAAMSQVLYITTCKLYEYSVLSTMYNALLKVTGTIPKVDT